MEARSLRSRSSQCSACHRLMAEERGGGQLRVVHPLNPIGAVQQAEFDLERVEHLLPHKRKLPLHLSLPFESRQNGGRRSLGIVVRIRAPEGRLLDIGAPVIGQIGLQRLQRGHFVVQVAVNDRAPRPERPLDLISGFLNHAALSKRSRFRERLSRPKAPCQWDRGRPARMIPRYRNQGNRVPSRRPNHARIPYGTAGKLLNHKKHKRHKTRLQSCLILLSCLLWPFSHGADLPLEFPLPCSNVSSCLSCSSCARSFIIHHSSFGGWDGPGGRPDGGQIEVAGRWSTKYDGAQAWGLNQSRPGLTGGWCRK